MKKIIVIICIALLVVYTNFNKKTEAFSDVPTNTYYAEAIKILSDRGVISGFPDGTFRPNDQITRGQVASIVARSLNLTPTDEDTLTFKDVPESHYFYSHIKALAQLKIINGYTDGNFGVDDTMTRGQAARVLALAYELAEANVTNTQFTDISKSIFKPQIETLYAHKVTAGLTSTTYGPDATLTRGSVAVLIKNIEDIKNNKQHIITYNELQAAKVAIEFEYKDTLDYFAISNDATTQKITLTPLKEGTTTIIWNVGSSDGSQKAIKNIITTKKLNGSLGIERTETKEIETARFTYLNDELTFTPTTVVVIKSDGKQTQTVDIKKLQQGYEIDFYASGNYTVSFSNGSSTEKANVQLKVEQYKLIGTSNFEQTKLLLTNKDVQANLSTSSYSLEKRGQSAIPVTITNKVNGLLVSAVSDGEATLKIVDGNKVIYFVIEVISQNGKKIINVYEAK